jgi:hypothetical protein
MEAWVFFANALMWLLNLIPFRKKTSLGSIFDFVIPEKGASGTMMQRNPKKARYAILDCNIQELSFLTLDFFVHAPFRNESG